MFEFASDDPVTERILVAARAVFWEQGLRGARMEAIAKRAGVAKPTLYARFANKDALFEAVVQAILAGLQAQVAAGLATEGSAADRVAEALARKYTCLAEVLQGSPHAAELADAPMAMALDALAALSDAVEGGIAEVLAAEGHEAPARLAHLVVACADGIRRHAPRPAEVAAEVRFAVQRLLRRETG